MKSKIKIGFDFDGIFVNLPPIIPTKFIDVLYKGAYILTLPKKAIVKELNYRFPHPLEQKIRILSHHPFFRPTIKDNVKELFKISENKSYETYLISSRFSFLKNRTDALLIHHKLGKHFKEIYFNYDNLQPHLFKEQTIKKLDINIYVDDDIDLILYLSAKIPKLMLFWIMNEQKKISLPKKEGFFFSI